MKRRREVSIELWRRHGMSEVADPVQAETIHEPVTETAQKLEQLKSEFRVAAACTQRISVLTMN
jgi:hypothetical protein